MGDANAPVQHRIVVGVDLSETGTNALREALRLGQHLPNSELHVTYVIEAAATGHDASGLKDVANELPARINDLRAHVTQLLASPWTGERFEQDTVLHVRIGSPARSLVQVAVDVDADFIVVGTRDRGGLERFFLGSVAEDLVRNAPLPVVVARPKDLVGMRKTAQPESAQPGDELRTASASDRLHLEFVPRTSHISGLI